MRMHFTFHEKDFMTRSCGIEINSRPLQYARLWFTPFPCALLILPSVVSTVLHCGDTQECEETCILNAADGFCTAMRLAVMYG
jgi:hypothetical protein